MDNIRFNKLVDRVRMVRLSNRRKDMGRWEPAEFQYPYADVFAIRRDYNTIQIGPDNPKGGRERTVRD